MFALRNIRAAARKSSTQSPSLWSAGLARRRFHPSNILKSETFEDRLHKVEEGQIVLHLEQKYLKKKLKEGSKKSSPRDTHDLQSGLRNFKAEMDKFDISFKAHESTLESTMNQAQTRLLAKLDSRNFELLAKIDAGFKDIGKSQRKLEKKFFFVILSFALLSGTIAYTASASQDHNVEIRFTQR